MDIGELRVLLRFASRDAQLLARDARVQLRLRTDRLQADIRFRCYFRISGIWFARNEGRLSVVGIGRLSGVVVMIVLRFRRSSS
jgi:hypothetical protein